ncbi:hypothetical protein HHL22_17305 [Hymenobacter sp. RP-2-7]|uniref:Lipoprotein n=1 Tax=Hymenobacter polaris TaxID=2682546 RepID=A0A7Y0AGK3_9BACT|nr:hypothetical protein [Hymenobacter polaris]NML66966.1 hypothetical protein [Hymenobacter polaris]
MYATYSLRSLVYTALASGLLLTASCRKTTETPTEDITTATDRSDANAEMALSTEAVRAISPAAASAGSANPETSGTDYTSPDADFRARFGSCATRTYNASLRLLTIDFGPTNCLCPDGRYRRGQILVQFTTDNGNTRRAGAVVTRKEYFVNDNQHTATRVFTDLGSGSFSVSVPSASIIYAAANGGGTHAWTASWTFTRTAGYGTATTLDDAYSVSGAAQGTNRKGVGYTTLIQTPLLKRGDCLKYYVHGTLSITNTPGSTLLLDYDPSNTQACDNTASVTVNGVTRTITLR